MWVTVGPTTAVAPFVLTIVRSTTSYVTTIPRGAPSTTEVEASATTSEAQAPPPLSNEAIGGAIIGSVLGIIIVFVVLWFCCLQQRRTTSWGKSSSSSSSEIRTPSPLRPLVPSAPPVSNQTRRRPSPGQSIGPSPPRPTGPQPPRPTGPLVPTLPPVPPAGPTPAESEVSYLPLPLPLPQETFGSVRSSVPRELGPHMMRRAATMPRELPGESRIRRSGTGTLPTLPRTESRALEIPPEGVQLLRRGTYLEGALLVRTKPRHGRPQSYMIDRRPRSPSPEGSGSVIDSDD